ncbi:uridine diphosphate-N-acetylglucosamine-binding protein YvcK [Candidatus Riflebacteria bacterium]
MAFLGLAGILGVIFNDFLRGWLLSLKNEPSSVYIFLFLIACILLCSISIAFYSFIRLTAYFQESIKNQPGFPETVFENRALSRGPKIVAIGGGTGLSALLTGLKNFTANITAVVTVTDDGGSSGILRKELGILPPGDIRNCLCALAGTEPLMHKLFQFRFNKGSGLSGHNFGNLFIAAMHEIMGDFAKSIRSSSQILNIRGTVLPVSTDQFNIGAHFKTGKTIIGETKLVKYKKPIASIFLEPKEIKPLKEVIEAINEADLILLGPGSLFTSVIPNLLVPGVAEAINSHPGYRIYICNVMSQPGETDGFSASDHVKTLMDQTPLRNLDYIAINTQMISPELIEKYKAEGAHVVEPDIGEILAMGIKVINGNMIDLKNVVRHSPGKLARILLNLIQPEKVPLKLVRYEEA